MNFLHFSSNFFFSLRYQRLLIFTILYFLVKKSTFSERFVKVFLYIFDISFVHKIVDILSFCFNSYYQSYLYHFLDRRFHNIYKKYENYSKTIFLDCWTINKTLSINEGINIWHRSPSVSKLMKILPILYFFAVCQNNFLGVLWRISHFIKPSKTWNIVYFINQTHIKITY